MYNKVLKSMTAGFGRDGPPDYGAVTSLVGVRTLENGLPSPNHNSGAPTAMAIWAAALCNPASEYYHSRSWRTD